MCPASLPTPDDTSPTRPDQLWPLSQKREFYGSKAKLVGLLLLGLVMVFAAFYVLRLPGLRQQVIGCSGVIFFGFCCVILARHGFDSGPLLILSEKGLEDRRLGCGLIPWDQVVAAKEETFIRQRFLCVTVSDPDQYLRKMPYYMQFFARGNQALSYSAITISFSGLDGTIEEALGFIQFQLTRVRLQQEKQTQ